MPDIPHNTVQRNRVELFRFPDRASVAIRIIRDDAAWLVLAREHGWVHGCRESAVADAKWLAANLGMPIREAAA